MDARGITLAKHASILVQAWHGFSLLGLMDLTIEDVVFNR